MFVTLLAIANIYFLNLILSFFTIIYFLLWLLNQQRNIYIKLL